MAGRQGEAAAPRLAGHERIGAAGATGQHVPQRPAFEVVQEEVGDDDVVALGRWRCSGPIEHVDGLRLHAPAGARVGRFRLVGDQRLPVEQRQLRLGDRGRRRLRDVEHQQAVAATELDDPQRRVAFDAAALHHASQRALQDAPRAHHCVDPAQVAARALGRGIVGRQMVERLGLEHALQHQQKKSATTTERRLIRPAATRRDN